MNYYMSRYSTGILYNFEFLVCISIFLVLLFFWKKFKEKNSMSVYLITGTLHSVVELIAEGVGTRVISITTLFGIIKLGYPFTAFILGFFEGGLFCLMAYYVVRIFMNKDRFALKFVLIFSIIFSILITLGAINMNMTIKSNPFSIIFTRREIFSSTAIILLILFFIISFSYFFLNKKILFKYKKSLLYFYFGMIYVTVLFIVPLHILAIRFIEVNQNNIFIYASLTEQIIIMYGFNIGLEAAGYFLPYYIIIYYFKLIELK